MGWAASSTRSQAEGGQWTVSDAATFTARQVELDRFMPFFAGSWDYSAPASALPHTTFSYDPLARVVKTLKPDSTFTSSSYQPFMEVRFDEEDNSPGSPGLIRHTRCTTMAWSDWSASVKSTASMDSVRSIPPPSAMIHKTISYAAWTRRATAKP